MANQREVYNDQFVGNDWAHYLIRRVHASNSKDINLAIILDTKIKKDPLKNVVDFLKKNFTEKYPNAAEVFNAKKVVTKLYSLLQKYRPKLYFVLDNYL